METISLSKGQKVDLTKGQATPLTTVVLGGGWDINKGNSGDFDLDLFAITLDANGKAFSMPKGLCYFSNMKLDGIELDKDNRTGAGDGDDERITLDLSKIPADVQAVAIGVNIFEASEKRQNFGMVQNAYIRLFRTDVKDAAGKDQELMKYDLSEDYGTNTAVILGKVYRRDGEWKFEAVGEGKSGDLNVIFNSYK